MLMLIIIFNFKLVEKAKFSASTIGRTSIYNGPSRAEWMMKLKSIKTRNDQLAYLHSFLVNQSKQKFIEPVFSNSLHTHPKRVIHLNRGQERGHVKFRGGHEFIYRKHVQKFSNFTFNFCHFQPSLRRFFEKDRPIYPGTVHFSSGNRPHSEAPSTFRQKTVHFNPGSSTLKTDFKNGLSFSPFWNVHIPPTRPHHSHAMTYSYFSLVVLFVQSELFAIFVVHTVWLEQCERANSKHV